MISLNGLLVVLSLFYKLITAFEYEILLRDEDIFQPCDEYPDGTLDTFVDISGLHFQTLDNDSIHVFGTSEITRPIKPTTTARLSIQVFKKDRNNWVNTIYNFNRADTCHATFDPSEMWHRYVENIPQEQQKCPFFTGQKLTFNVVSDLIVNLPDPRLAGDYKTSIAVTLEDGESTSVLCSSIYATFYRK